MSKTYTISEAAEVLGVSRQRVDWLVRNNKLPATTNRFGIREIPVSAVARRKKNRRNPGRPKAKTP